MSVTTRVKRLEKQVQQLMASRRPALCPGCGHIDPATGAGPCTPKTMLPIAADGTMEQTSEPWREPRPQRFAWMCRECCGWVASELTGEGGAYTARAAYRTTCPLFRSDPWRDPAAAGALS